MFYRVVPAEGFEWTILKHPEQYLQLQEQLDGSSRRADWVPLEVYRAKADDRQPGWPADFPWCSSLGLVMRRRALDALVDMLGRNGEILPLKTNDAVELFIFNSQLVSALDESKSEIVRFPNSNRILHLKRPVLLQEMLGGCDIFRLPYPGTSTYVSEQFVNRVNDRGLVGLTFEPVTVT